MAIADFFTHFWKKIIHLVSEDELNDFNICWQICILSHVRQNVLNNFSENMHAWIAIQPFQSHRSKQTDKYIHTHTRRLFKFLKINSIHSCNGLVYQFNRVVWCNALRATYICRNAVNFRTHEAILCSFNPISLSLRYKRKLVGWLVQRSSNKEVYVSMQLKLIKMCVSIKVSWV